MFETSYIELNSKAYQENLKFLTKEVSGIEKICSVIKGNAYGHGDREFLRLAQSLGVRTFSVFNAFEALRVQPEIAPGSRLIIMGDLHHDQIPWALEHDVEFYINNLESLHRAIEYAGKLKKSAQIHLELETGMHRLGIEKVDYPEALALIHANREAITVRGICTHFAGSESISNYVRVNRQQKLFEAAVKAFRLGGLDGFQAHAACSAASIRMKKTIYDMARIGILQYGYWPSQETFIDYVAKKKDHANPIQGILTWKSRVMAIKDVPMGSHVGYGTSYLTESRKKMAIVPVGYANGFSRSLSNQGRVLIHGKRVSVAGIVNMNAITVDVTTLENVQIGDEVVLIGQQGEQKVTVSHFGDYSNQLNYELLTRLPMDIPRLIK